MNTGKQMIALFIVIGACLGIAAFVLVLTSKQSTKCPIKENLVYSAVEVAPVKANQRSPTVNPGQLANKWQTGSANAIENLPYMV